MLPASVWIHQLFCVCVLFILCTSVRCRPLTDDRLEDILKVIKDRLLKSQTNTNKMDDMENYRIDLDTEKSHIPYALDSDEMPKFRTKRLGIAGHENIDMILSTLTRTNNARPNLRGRFRPALSISGSIGDLRNMMQKAG